MNIVTPAASETSRPQTVVELEASILKRNARKIVRACEKGGTLNVIEVGAASARRGLCLKGAAARQNVQFNVRSISLPEFEEDSSRLIRDPAQGALVLFLGDRIGDLTPAERVWLLSRFRCQMVPGDFFLTAFGPDFSRREILRLQREAGFNPGLRLRDRESGHAIEIWPAENVKRLS